VQVPVRQGFEEAIITYLSTGQAKGPWSTPMGAGTIHICRSSRN
jgi:hypothetical protein